MGFTPEFYFTGGDCDFSVRSYATIYHKGDSEPQAVDLPWEADFRSTMA